MNLVISVDVNGNKLIKLTFTNCNGFSIQTNGSLPNIDRMTKGNIDEKIALQELTEYIKEHGTDKQKQKFFLNAPIQINIIGRKWFDRVNGNTYFSAIGMVNGKQVVNIYYEYGYGNQYEDSVFDELEKLGYFPTLEHYSNGSKEQKWQYCGRTNTIINSTVSDVSRKKDL